MKTFCLSPNTNHLKFKEKALQLLCFCFILHYKTFRYFLGRINHHRIFIHFPPLHLISSSCYPRDNQLKASRLTWTRRDSKCQQGKEVNNSRDKITDIYSTENKKVQQLPGNSTHSLLLPTKLHWHWYWCMWVVGHELRINAQQVSRTTMFTEITDTEMRSWGAFNGNWLTNLCGGVDWEWFNQRDSKCTRISLDNHNHNSRGREIDTRASWPNTRCDATTRTLPNHLSSLPWTLKWQIESTVRMWTSPWLESVGLGG